MVKHVFLGVTLAVTLVGLAIPQAGAADPPPSAPKCPSSTERCPSESAYHDPVEPCRGGPAVDIPCRVHATLEAKFRGFDGDMALFEVAVPGKATSGVPVLDKLPYIGKVFQASCCEPRTTVIAIPRTQVDLIEPIMGNPTAKEWTPQRPHHPAPDTFAGADETNPFAEADEAGELPPAGLEELPAPPALPQDDLPHYLPPTRFSTVIGSSQVVQAACNSNSCSSGKCASSGIVAFGKQGACGKEGPVKHVEPCAKTITVTVCGTSCGTECKSSGNAACATACSNAKTCPAECGTCEATETKTETEKGKNCDACNCGSNCQCGQGSKCDSKCTCQASGKVAGKCPFRALVAMARERGAGHGCPVMTKSPGCPCSPTPVAGHPMFPAHPPIMAHQPYAPYAFVHPPIAHAPAYHDPVPHDPVLHGPGPHGPGIVHFQPRPVAPKTGECGGRQELVEQVMALTVENARLQVESEARAELALQREEFLDEYIEMKIENAQLQARLELVEEKRELIDTLVQAMVEKARLEGAVESMEERAALAMELVKARTHVETARPQVEYELAKSRTENAELKQRVAQLERKLSELADAVARTADAGASKPLEELELKPRY